MAVIRDVIDSIMHRRCSAQPDSDLFSTVGSFARTTAEISAGVTPVNYAYATQPLNILRFGADPTGVSDSSIALQNAINVALATSGSGKYGVSIYAPPGAYLITTPPTFGGSTTAMLPITIYGDGNATQFINNAPSGTSALFNMTGKNGWRLRDFLICGNDAHKNDGIYAGTTGGPEQIQWRVERITAMMAGQGLRVADTNDGFVWQFIAWPNNSPALIVPQTVTRSNIKEHIICTGGFVNFVTFRDCVTPCSTNFGASAAFAMNCTVSAGVFIDGLDVETYDGTQGSALLLQPVSSGTALKVGNVYCETAFCQFSNIQNSHFGPFTDGGVGGVFQFQSTCRQNAITGVNVATLNIIDSASTGNIFLGCESRTAFADGTEGANLSGQPNRYIGCGLFGASFSNTADLGNNWRTLLTYSASMTADVLGPSMRVIRVTNGTAFTIALTHPRNGQQMRIVLHNESGGAMGAVTWSGIFTPTAVPLPATGFNRTYGMHYDSDFSVWRMDWWSPADVANG